MARYTGPDCKRCRREKTKLFLKGAKCDSPKCPMESRPYPPGQHGRGRSKDSEYLLQKREKQKAARIYGVLEKQFRGYYEEASRKHGKTGENLLRILESRLDKVDIPSFRVSPNDVVEVAKKSLELTPFQVAYAEIGERPVPGWLEVIPAGMRILVHSLPAREAIDTQVQEQLIVELYSK